MSRDQRSNEARPMYEYFGAEVLVVDPDVLKEWRNRGGVVDSTIQGTREVRVRFATDEAAWFKVHQVRVEKWAHPTNEAQVPPMNRCGGRRGDDQCTRLSCHLGPCEYEPRRDGIPLCGERTEDGKAECVQVAGHEQRGMAHSFRPRSSGAPCKTCGGSRWVWREWSIPDADGDTHGRPCTECPRSPEVQPDGPRAVIGIPTCAFCEVARQNGAECPRHPRTGNEDTRPSDAQSRFGETPPANLAPYVDGTAALNDDEVAYGLRGTPVFGIWGPEDGLVDVRYERADAEYAIQLAGSAGEGLRVIPLTLGGQRPETASLLHTQECLEYAAKTRRAFCIASCADRRRGSAETAQDLPEGWDVVKKDNGTAFCIEGPWCNTRREAVASIATLRREKAAETAETDHRAIGAGGGDEQDAPVWFRELVDAAFALLRDVDGGELLAPGSQRLTDALAMIPQPWAEWGPEPRRESDPPGVHNEMTLLRARAETAIRALQQILAHEEERGDHGSIYNVMVASQALEVLDAAPCAGPDPKEGG